jgi:hypothetical protein
MGDKIGLRRLVNNEARAVNDFHNDKSKVFQLVMK